MLEIRTENLPYFLEELSVAQFFDLLSLQLPAHCKILLIMRAPLNVSFSYHWVHTVDESWPILHQMKPFGYFSIPSLQTSLQGSSRVMKFQNLFCYSIVTRGSFWMSSMVMKFELQGFLNHVLLRLWSSSLTLYLIWQPACCWLQKWL